MKSEISEDRLISTRNESDKLIAFVLRQGEKFLEESEDPERSLERAENSNNYLWFY